MVAKRAIVLNYLTTDILTSAASCTLGVSRPSRGPELSAKVFVNFCSVLSKFLKMTQINFVSRNQLHNIANSCHHLNEFWLELAWLGAKCKGKTLLVIEIFFALHIDCTALYQPSIITQYSKQIMIKFFQQPG